MTNLCKLSSFLRIKEDIINKERNITQFNALKCFRSLKARFVANEFFLSCSLEFNLNFVILKSNQRQSKSRVSAEPELERDKQHITLLTSRSHLSKFRNFTDHLLITLLLRLSVCKFIPEIEPHTILLIDLRTTNSEGNIINKCMSQSLNKSKLLVRCRNSLNFSLKVSVHNKITISWDGEIHDLIKSRSTRCNNGHSLHCKVSMSSVGNLEESDLRIACQVHILCTICN